MTDDNIYYVLYCFGKLYEVMNNEERRNLMLVMIDEIRIHQQLLVNGQGLKSVRFCLSIIREDFSLVNAQEQRMVEPGRLVLMVSHSSRGEDC